jgi:hypothetical protein
MTRSKKDFTQVAFDVFQKAVGESDIPAPLTGRKASSSKGENICGIKRTKSKLARLHARIANICADTLHLPTPAGARHDH